MEINQSKRIGIDARFYGPVNKGLGRYTQEIVDRLTAADDGRSYVVFLRRENFDTFSPANPKVEKVLAEYRWYSFAEQFFFPRAIAAAKLDLMYFLHFNVPLFVRTPFVVTVHDLILTRFPTRRASTMNAGFYWIKHLLYRLVIWFALKRARAVVAVSDFTRRDILGKYRLPEGKVSVVYEGVAETILHTDAANDNKVTFRYNIHNNYLLYVGNAYPHKNLDGLIDFYTKVREEHPDIRLVLVGKSDYFYEGLKKYALRQNQGQGIVFTDYVSDRDLAALYRNALAYVFPSFYEGFGLPPLEAMSQGCPVICSNAACLPEILGDAALFFDPKNGDEFRAVLSRLLTEPGLRGQLRLRGLARVARYRWEDSARAVHAIIDAQLDPPR